MNVKFPYSPCMIFAYTVQALAKKMETVMAHQAYYPSSEAEEIKWLSNFINKLPLHAVTLKLPPDQVSSTIADIQFYLWTMQQYNPATQKFSQESTALKNHVANGAGTELCTLPAFPAFTQVPAARLPGVLKRLAKFVQHIKLNDAYSESTGQDLGIIGSQENFKNSEYITVSCLAVNDRGELGERVKITFKKHGHDGVWIEGRRNNGDWEFLGVTLIKPWYDERALLQSGIPEIREYRLRWWDKSTPNGDFCPVQRVTVGP